MKTRIHSLPPEHRKTHRAESTYDLTPRQLESLRRMYRLARLNGSSALVARSVIKVSLLIGWEAGFDDCSRIWKRRVAA